MNCGGKCGGKCGGCPPGTPGQVVHSTGRVPTEAEPAPQTGYGRLGDRNWDVQAFTGQPVSTVPAGRWYRGSMERAAMPTMVHDATYPGPMYDPTDARTWPANQAR